MKEAIGGSGLLYIVIIIVSVVVLLFVGILSYSKAYRVKNRIIEVVEKYGDYNDTAKKAINQELSRMGYNTFFGDFCSSGRVTNHISEMGLNPNEVINLNSSDGYNYCIFELNKTNNGKYYVIVSFVHFEIPLIGEMLTIPVYGETKILGLDYNY